MTPQSGSQSEGTLARHDRIKQTMNSERLNPKVLERIELPRSFERDLVESC